MKPTPKQSSGPGAGCLSAFFTLGRRPWPAGSGEIDPKRKFDGPIPLAPQAGVQSPTVRPQHANVVPRGSHDEYGKDWDVNFFYNDHANDHYNVRSQVKQYLLYHEYDLPLHTFSLQF